MLKKLSLQDVSLQNKKVLMRVDFNVPLNADGEITDDTRIRSVIPSIQYIKNQNAKLILLSHLGRPKGTVNAKYTLAPCAKRLSKLLQSPVVFASDCIGPKALSAVDSLNDGDIALVENLRFHKGEEKPKEDPSFVTELARLGEIYVNDAFGVSHRKHASIYELPKLFPGKSVAGFLLDKEIAFLTNLIQQPKRPYFAILGGAKVSTKVGLIFPLIDKIDGLFLGGAMTFTFLKAQGISVGDSPLEEEQVEIAKEIIKKCDGKAVKLWLPVDVVIAKKDSSDTEHKVQSTKENIPNGWAGMDIGPKTIQEWSEALQNAATVFWNGPLGVFENPAFATGTLSIAKTLSQLQATTVVGGGDSLAAVQKSHLSEKFTHLSTGGGASLEFLEFGHLPGVDVLSDR